MKQNEPCYGWTPFLDGRKGWALGLRELGAAAGGVDAVAVSMAARRLTGRARRDSALVRAIEACRQKLNC